MGRKLSGMFREKEREENEEGKKEELKEGERGRRDGLIIRDTIR